MPENEEKNRTGIILLAGLGLLSAVLLIPRIVRAEPPQAMPGLEPAKGNVTNVTYNIVT